MAETDHELQVPALADRKEILHEPAVIIAPLISASLLALTVTCLTVIGWGAPDPDANLYPYPNTQETLDHTPSLVSAIGTLIALFLLVLCGTYVGTAIVMLIFVWPAYAFLKSRDMLQAHWILIASWLAGFAAALLYIPYFSNTDSTPNLMGILLAGAFLGIYTLIGGIVFCWMTMWKKPAVNGASHAPE